MFRHARLLTLCLLLLSLPVKGAVAASMVTCGPTQDRGAVARESIPHAHHAGHDRQIDSDVGHGHHVDGDQVQSPAHDANVANDDRIGKHGFFDCGSCAACCAVGSSITAAALTVPPLAGTDPAFPAVTVQFSGHIPAGLERPPHTFLV
jgi:hypothetical protein